MTDHIADISVASLLQSAFAIGDVISFDHDLMFGDRKFRVTEHDERGIVIEPIPQD